MLDTAAADEMIQLYEKVFSTGEKLIQQATKHLGLESVTPTEPNKSLVAINTLPTPRHEIIKAPPLPDRSSYAYISPFSDSTTGSSKSTGLCEVSPIPSFAHSFAPINASRVTLQTISPFVYHLENAHYSVRVSHGTITSLHSKLLDRQLVPSGKKMNQLVLFDDKPLYWQAWDVEVYHLQSRKELTPGVSFVSEQGPLRVAIETWWKISEQSWAKTTISLTGVPLLGPGTSASSHDTPAVPIEFSAEVEWREDKKFLKVEFPTTLAPLHNQFVSETQYGMISRPTHRNTSWDSAKFEVIGHRFSALHEARDGLAVLNDTKYGFAAEAGTMRLSILRAPKAPDGHADMGRQWCRWGLLPFANGVAGGGLDRVVHAARAFNNPVAVPVANGIGRIEEDEERNKLVHDFCNTLNIEDEEFEDLSNNNGKGNRGSSALFPYTRLSDYIFAAEPDILPGLASLLSSVTLRQPKDSIQNLVLDTIKRGEDDEDLLYDGSLFPAKNEKSIIIRIYEACGSRGLGRVCIGKELTVARIRKCNLLEDEDSDDDVVVAEEGEKTGAKFAVDLRAWEVATYRIVLDL